MPDVVSAICSIQLRRMGIAHTQAKIARPVDASLTQPLTAQGVLDGDSQSSRCIERKATALVMLRKRMARVVTARQRAETTTVAGARLGPEASWDASWDSAMGVLARLADDGDVELLEESGCDLSK